MARKATSGNIVLIGFMGSGKTEVGRRLASRTGREFVDTDSLVEREGLSIADIFAAEGERGFRRREERAVASVARCKSTVIATGGGVILTDNNLKVLKRAGVLVYLKVGFEELARRLENGGDRPLLNQPDSHVGDGLDEQRSENARRKNRIKSMLSDRSPLYESAADVIVPCDGLDVEGVMQEILRRAEPGSSASRLGFVDVAVSPSYRVQVGRGLITRAAATLAIPASAEKACIISHPRVNRLWGDALAEGLSGTRLQLSRFTFAEGEDRKNIDTAARIYRRLAANGFHRSDLLIALGGGVVGDMTGFVASTYSRGINFIQVPTTLLAMVDAAVGGKTGFNLPEGKNLVGTFHQPSAVLCDLDVLKTLPERELRGGLAEVVKYSLIADPALGDLVLEKIDAVFARDAVLEPIVLRSVELKAQVVADDEKETGIRAMLNYGHTLGHALEALSLAGRISGPRGSSTLHHGEAISIGMVFAAWVSVILGLAGPELVDEHIRLLSGVGLPVRVQSATWQDVRRYMALDKKYSKGLRLVLLEKPGRPVLLGDIPQKALAEAFSRIQED